MSESQYQPLYRDKNKSPINFMLILGLGAAVFGFVTPEPTLMMIGIAVAIYAWYTTPSSYLLYNDRLLIVYGRPRVRHVMFENIEGVDNLMVPLSGQRLRVREFRGRGAWLTPRNPDAFLEQLGIAIQQIRGTASGEPGEFVPFQSQEEIPQEESPQGEPEELQPEDGTAETMSGEQFEESASDSESDTAPPEQEDPWDRR
jgi:hypothetical protein